jgi:hypothetical protein
MAMRTKMLCGVCESTIRRSNGGRRPYTCDCPRHPGYDLPILGDPGPTGSEKLLCAACETPIHADAVTVEPFGIPYDCDCDGQRVWTVTE